MALADLLALARRNAPTPKPVTSVTPNSLRAGYRVDAVQTGLNQQLQEPVTRVTPVTRDSSIVGRSERTALTVPDDASPATHELPTAEWVEAMAKALMRNPIYRIPDNETGLAYFRGRALHMLAVTPDPYARGLMLADERLRHVIAEYSEATPR